MLEATESCGVPVVHVYSVPGAPKELSPSSCASMSSDLEAGEDEPNLMCIREVLILARDPSV